MERITGESTTSAIRHQRYISEDWMLFLLGSLLDGLRLVHERGFIHRDIKPDNIYLRDDLSPVLLDFGFARMAVESRTQSLTALVTPGFAPFEQFQTDESAGRQGPWTDIYSLAATVYSAISDKRRVPDAFARVNTVTSNLPDPMVPALELGRGRFSDKFLAAIDVPLQVQPGGGISSMAPSLKRIIISPLKQARIACRRWGLRAFRKRRSARRLHLAKLRLLLMRTKLRNSSREATWPR